MPEKRVSDEKNSRLHADSAMLGHTGRLWLGAKEMHPTMHPAIPRKQSNGAPKADIIRKSCEKPINSALQKT
jgi:hypothetical protein